MILYMLSGFGHPQENALPATTLHQTFRRSGFHGGRLVPRGWGRVELGLLLEEPAEVFSRRLAVWDGGCHRAEEKGALQQQRREGEE